MRKSTIVALSLLGVILTAFGVIVRTSINQEQAPKKMTEKNSKSFFIDCSDPNVNCDPPPEDGLIEVNTEGYGYWKGYPDYMKSPDQRELGWYYSNYSYNFLTRE